MEGCGVLGWPSGRSAKVEWQDLYLKRTRGPDDRRERLVLAEREQPSDSRIIATCLCDLRVENSQIRAQPIELPQVPFDCRALVIGIAPHR